VQDLLFYRGFRWPKLAKKVEKRGRKARIRHTLDIVQIDQDPLRIVI
jgi:hypothetical protein